MKKTIDFYEFRDAFNRMDRGEQFSREGLEILFNALQDFEDETNEEIELDVIALCCDFCEMTEMEIRDAYRLEDSESSTQYLNDHTWVLGSTETTVIFREF